MADELDRGDPALAPGNVVQALAAVMADLPAIGKESRNRDQGYSFRGIEDITASAQKLCARHGVVFTPQVTDWEEAHLTINNKPWTEQRLHVTYRVYGPGGPGDFIEVRTVGIGRDNSDKGANKAMSQAFKYALMQTLMVADSVDDGDQTTPEADTAPQRVVPRPRNQLTLHESPRADRILLDRVRQLAADLKDAAPDVHAKLVHAPSTRNVTVANIDLVRDGGIVATPDDASKAIEALTANLDAAVNGGDTPVVVPDDQEPF